MPNFLVTGAQGAGKSTVLARVIDTLHLQVDGFQTLPYTVDGAVRGHYLHSLQPLARNNLPITVRTGERTCTALPSTFGTVGVPCLEQAIASPAPVLLLDEIGRIEQACPAYLDGVHRALDCPKLVLGTLKKEPVPFILEILRRGDVILFDLDQLGAEQTYQSLVESVKLCL